MHKGRSTTVRHFWAIFLAIPFVSLACQRNAGREAAGLHELEHVIPAHWPTDLGDCAAKIRARMDRLDDPATIDTVWKEMSELVEWGPQVAADTDLAEKDWLPLFESAESLAARLRKGASTWSPEFRGSLEAYCTLLETKLSEIPPPEKAIP